MFTHGILLLKKMVENKPLNQRTNLGVTMITLVITSFLKRLFRNEEIHKSGQLAGFQFTIS